MQGEEEALSDMGFLLCAVCGPLKEQEAEQLCPELLLRPDIECKDRYVFPRVQPDLRDLKRAVTQTPTFRDFAWELDELRRQSAAAHMDRLGTDRIFLVGASRRALLRGKPEEFDYCFQHYSRIDLRNCHCGLSHIPYWNALLGPEWLAFDMLPQGAGRDELLRLLGMRYAFFPYARRGEVPLNEFPLPLQLAWCLADGDLSSLPEPAFGSREEQAMTGARLLLKGEWKQAHRYFYSYFRATTAMVYQVLGEDSAPLLVYALIAAIRNHARPREIERWIDTLQRVLPLFCPEKQMESMVSFIHHWRVWDYVMNRNGEPSYVPDTSSDLACLPLALCYRYFRGPLRRALPLPGLWAAVEKCWETVPALCAFYAADALSPFSRVPDILQKKLQEQCQHLAPLLEETDAIDGWDESLLGEMEDAVFNGPAEKEVLAWELNVEKDTRILAGIRPKLLAFSRVRYRDVSLSQCEAYCCLPQDYYALNLARSMESGNMEPLKYLGNLAGHPHLYMFRQGNRPAPIRLESTRPSVVVQRDKHEITLSWPGCEIGRLLLAGENHWVVEENGAVQEKLRGFFFNNGKNTALHFPLSQEKALYLFIERLSASFSVQGTLSHQTKVAEGDSSLVAMLQFQGTLLHIRIAVALLPGAERHPSPGEGASPIDVQTTAGIVSVLRQLEKERRNMETLRRSCPAVPQTPVTEWQVEGMAAAMETLVQLADAGVQLIQDDGTMLPVYGVRQKTLALHAKPITREWFEIGAELVVNESLVLSLQQMLEAYGHCDGPNLRLPGAILRLPPELEKRLAVLKRLLNFKNRSYGLSVAALPALAESWGRAALPPALQRCAGQLMPDKEPEVPAGLQAELRPYQVAGFRWLASRAACGIGCCLADDMGLGKTLQLIALLLHRRLDGPSLVVAPLSLLRNWRDELQRFAPGLRIASFLNQTPLPLLLPGDVVLASYGQVCSHLKEFGAIPWNVLVLDEAQAIKNSDSQRAKAVSALHASAKVCLTGTPLENGMMDLWSLMHFLNPLLLGTKGMFRRRYQGAGQKDLQALVAPLIMRRTKAEVLQQLPPLTEKVLMVQLSEEERALYENLRRRAYGQLHSGPDNAFSVLAELTRLRRACCHGALVMPGFSGESSKMNQLLELLAEMKKVGHKVLVFSQFTDVLDIAQDLFDNAGLTFERLDGSLSASKRAKAVTRFQKGQADVFLISLKAGGTGLNLTAADYVVLLDPWWNPAVEAQAASRSHRLGQNRPVSVYRLIAENTVEERVLALHAEKKDLAEQLLSGVSGLEPESIEKLLEE